MVPTCASAPLGDDGRRTLTSEGRRAGCRSGAPLRVHLSTSVAEPVATRSAPFGKRRSQPLPASGEPGSVTSRSRELPENLDTRFSRAACAAAVLSVVRLPAATQVSFKEQKCFIITESIYLFLPLLFIFSVSRLKNVPLPQELKSFLLCSRLEIAVLTLMFRSMI